MIWTVIMSLAGGFTALFVFVYYFRKGDFNDLEEAKYHVFRDGNEDS
jgi:hypothetical protein